MSLLNKIKLPEGLKQLSASELEGISKEIREKIIDVVASNGGHLSSSLGTVELAVALHAVLSSPKDKIVWDVGHQAYAHKILTGRLSEFPTLRKYHGLSGFPNFAESPHDPFTVGHAGTSISTALGLAKARDMLGEKYTVVAVIGDGSLSGGLALEGINNVLGMKSNFIVILNDNEMSISRNVGAWAEYFTKVRTSPLYLNIKERTERILSKIPKIGVPMTKTAERLKDRFKHFIVDFKFEVVFEELGFNYLGPIDGHNIPLLMGTLQYARDLDEPVLIHIYTKKGKGYAPAERDPVKFHSSPPFDRYTGNKIKYPRHPTYTKIFGDSLVKLAESDNKIVAITAAMLDGTGLEEFAAKFPGRFFDVGIAEEHAVAFAAGLSRAGFKPVVAIYSTFLQRSYDQIIHDVCLQNLPVVFCLDRAGIVGEDGPTHHGIFDISYLRLIPNLVLMAPGDENEFRHMLATALSSSGPVAIRYPRAEGQGVALSKDWKPIPIGKGELCYKSKIIPPLAGQNSKVLMLGIGSMVYPAMEAAKILEKEKISVNVINARFVKPLDKELIPSQAKEADLVVTLEEGSLLGGFGDAILELFAAEGLKKKTKCLGIPDEFVEHGERELLLEKYGLSPGRIAETILNLC